MAETIEWDETVDVLAVGSGGAALTGAYSAAARGLDTLVVEKTEYFGGTTAYAGACLWLPGNQAQARAGVEDSADLARAYFRSLVGDSTPHAMQDAYLDGAGPTVEFLERSESVRFEYRPFPDYYPGPGRFDAGRGVFPVTLERPEDERSRALLDAVRPPVSSERLGLPTPEGPLEDGRALIGRLLLALDAAGGRARTRTAFTGLVQDEDGRIVGAEVRDADGRTVRIRARRGVLLAAGGYERDAELRREWGNGPGADWTMGPAGGGTGDALRAARGLGAATSLLGESWWCPSVLFPDGGAAFALGFRGGIFVDAEGRRFANECLSYDRMGRAMIAAGAGDAADRPVWWVWDARHGEEPPGIVLVPVDRESFEAGGVWHSASSVEELAEAIGVPGEGLAATVATFNKYAENGHDPDFGRGDDPYDRFFAGEGEEGAPNPCLLPLSSGSFHAVRMVLGDLGTKGGLVTDVDARVLREDGSVIEGLYAVGNTAANVTGPVYPGPGAPIGTGMVFGYRAAGRMANTSSTCGD
ncbi:MULTISPECIES: FAD-dependent oxidoreductase [unclassified Streptomyces]|uniref:FAD-dependent oxidoreductase n=1 Tax=unclassified Streptomyces TaxID=2593676 RepID=UPI00278C6872|nr:MULTISPECIES: FAD-dependent oxidoreductase [unclassified Streptomyces]